jgi:hypothetical protein
MRQQISYKYLNHEQKLAYHREMNRRAGDRRAAMGLTRSGKPRAPKKDMTVKVCAGCKRVLPRTHDYFYHSRRGACASRCRECHRSEAGELHRLPGRQVGAVYETLVKNSVCWICERADDLVIDHDRETGRDRGILCRRCAGLLRRWQERSDLFQRAADYLKHHLK